MLLAGEIGKPHGLGGEVYLVPISDDPRRFVPGARLIRTDGTALVIERHHPHRAGRWLTKFEGIDTREDAETLRGAVYVPEGEARELAEGEFRHEQLIGCSVTDPAGTHLGEVVGIMDGVAHDLLTISTPRGERLVPLVKAIVSEVDVDGKRVVIDPPQGLLD